MLMLGRRHQRLSIVLLGLSLGGCSKSGRETQEAAAAEQPAVVEPVAAGEGKPAPVCDEEHREAVRKELQDMSVWSGHLVVVEAPMSPWSGSPYSSRSYGVQIAVDRAQIRMLPDRDREWLIGEGNPLDKQTPIAISDFATALATFTSRETSMSGEAEPPGWSLQVAGDVPSSVVAEVLRSLANTKMLDGQIVLQNPDGPVAVRDPVLHANLIASRMKQAPGQRIEWAKQELNSYAGPCLSFEDTFEAVSLVETTQIGVAFASGLVVAMSDCGCAREDEILTVMYVLYFGEDPPKNRAATVRAKITPDVTPRRGKTWGDIVAGFEKKEDVLSLWVSGDE